MSATAPEWMGLLRTHTERFAAIVRDAEREAPVTYCPGWTLGDLVVHLGGVHQWATHTVAEGNPDFRPRPVEPGRPDLADWYHHHASTLVDVLTTTPAAAPAWTMDERDPTAGFWRRRQVHETVMHAWDAQEALGEPPPMEPWLAWDGVLEVRDIIYPRQVRLGRVEALDRAVHLVATDVPGDITIGAGEPVVIRDRAELILRLLWHRANPATETVDPQAGVLQSAALTP